MIFSWNELCILLDLISIHLFEVETMHEELAAIYDLFYIFDQSRQ